MKYKCHLNEYFVGLLQGLSSSSRWISIQWIQMDVYTVHGTLQAIILEWIAFPFSRGSSQPRDQTQISHTGGGFFTSLATKDAQVDAPHFKDPGLQSLTMSSS